MLDFDLENFSVKTCELDGRKIIYRAFEQIDYCEKPKEPIQKLNLFAPEVYFHGEKIGKFDLKTAPIFMPNTVGGYMPGAADVPGMDTHGNRVNSIFAALEHGYIVASVGVRGRTSGKISDEFFEGSSQNLPSDFTGKMIGRAPALIVDYKAAIRYLRHNKNLIPGNTEKIITNGTSAGGALSALAGTTGNCVDYEKFLNEIGAADDRDDIFAASCYCPIHNLENADAAYEWQFCGQNTYFRTKHKRTDSGIIRVPDNGVLTQEQIEISPLLKKIFPDYVNSLNLKDSAEKILSLDSDGEGSFKNYVKKFVVESAESEFSTHKFEKSCPELTVKGSKIDEQDYLQIQDGHVVNLDWDSYIAKITRMKQPPAFDSLDLKSPENEEFGDETVEARHFTKFSMDHSKIADAELADEKIIGLMNPVSFIGKNNSKIAKNWRIRHGAFDRDTSIAIPIILAALLENNGFNVDFALTWGLPHSGDYDLDDLFAWIDGLLD